MIFLVEEETIRAWLKFKHLILPICTYFIDVKTTTIQGGIII